MSNELTIFLEQKARGLCDFYDFLNILDRGILLNLIAAMSEDEGSAKIFVEKLKKKKKYQRRLALVD